MGNRNRIVLIWLLLGLGIANRVFAQEDSLNLPLETESVVQELSGLSIDYAALREEFLNREEAVLNLSKPDPLDLLAIPGISPQQADVLHGYILQYGPPLSIWELNRLPGFDSATVATAAPYLIFEPDLTSGSKRIRNQLSLAASADGKYRLRGGWKAGSFADLALSYREAKEPLPGQPAEGPADRLHGCIRYSGGRGEELILGDFRASCGQGLTFAPGSGIFVNTEDWRRRSGGIRAYSGYSGFGSLRGLAGKVRTGGLKTEVFLSALPDQQVYGGHLRYGRHLWNAGITLVHARMAADTTPPGDLYTIYYNRSGIFQMAGLDIVGILGKTALYAEFSIPAEGKPGMIAGLRYDPIPRLGVQVMLRHLPAGFQNPFASVYTVNGNPSNEQSVSFQVRAAVAGSLNLTSGLDLARHPWYRYRCDHAAVSMIYNLNAQITLNRKAGLLLNWRRKLSYGNSDNERPLHELEYQEKQSFRVVLTQEVSESLEFNSRAVVLTDRKQTEKGEGYLLSQEMVLRAGDRIRIRFRYSLYETDGYAQSIYLFAQNVPEIYSMRPYYGRGQCLDLAVSWKIFRKFRLHLQGNFETATQTGMQFAFQYSP